MIDQPNSDVLINPSLPGGRDKCRIKKFIEKKDALKKIPIKTASMSR